MTNNLESLLARTKGIAHYLYNMQTGPNVYPGVPPEYTNWRDEQKAWQQTCVLFNQSYHMAELQLEGPDALKLLTRLGINTFANFTPDRAKQFIPCTPDGYVIGDVILFYLAENTFSMVGRIPVINWVMYHAATGGFNVKAELDERTAARQDPSRRRNYRFELQGPNAMQVIEKATGQPAPNIKFFHMTWVEIAGKQVRALRHGMVGQPGLELFGPWDEGETVRQALIEAGKEFGLHLVGGRAYSSTALESGWIPSPLPAIYTGAELKAYREWLPANGYEAKASLGGSFYSDNVEDYYLTPWDLGYGHIVKFDHDFIGRAALEKKVNQPHRRKVTLALDSDAVTQVLGRCFDKTGRPKFMEFPSAVYSMHPFDRVLDDGQTVGLSTWIGYSSNEARMLTLAMVDEAHSKPGTQVALLWGEPNGGSAKTNVERHVQVEIPATVSPVPYVEVAQKIYAPAGWRAHQPA